MSWLYGYLSPGKEPQARILRAHSHSHISAGLQVYAGGKGKNMQVFENPVHKGETIFVLGDPILRENEDFRYPTAHDWQRLLKDESLLNTMDGHYLILIADQGEIRAYNDPFCLRSLWIHKSAAGYFFASDLSLLKEAGYAKLELESFGAYWHSLFPADQRHYAPSHKSYYKDVQMLFQAGSLKLNASVYELKSRPFQPATQRRDLIKMVENLVLLPLKSGRQICFGLTGGMDVRALYAVALSSGYPFSAAHFGPDDTQDFLIAQAIAKETGMPFYHVSEAEAEGSWEDVQKYLFTRGFGYNPASSVLMNYFPILARSQDGFVSGCFGELYRFRFMLAHIKSMAQPRGLDYRALQNYLYLKPPSFFIPEVNKALHEGFGRDLQAAVSQMPDSRSMPNAQWLNLFLVRYAPRIMYLPDLAYLDDSIQDFMPWLTASIAAQHWQYPYFKQLLEGVHRSLIKRHAPQLQSFALAVDDTAAPYRAHPYYVKLKVRLQKKNHPGLSRTAGFIKKYYSEIQLLRAEKRVREDAWIDQKKLDIYLKKAAENEPTAQNAIMAFVSYVLGA